LTLNLVSALLTRLVSISDRGQTSGYPSIDRLTWLGPHSHGSVRIPLIARLSSVAVKAGYPILALSSMALASAEIIKAVCLTDIS